MARAIVDGKVPPIDGASEIANLGTADCYDFLQEGVDAVDEMAGFTPLVDDWELRQDDSAARLVISEEIKEAAAAFWKKHG